MRKLCPYIVCALLAGLVLAMPGSASAKRYQVIRDGHGHVKVVDPTDNFWYKATHPVQYVSSLVTSTASTVSNTVAPVDKYNFYRPVTQKDMQKPASISAAANQVVDSTAQLVTDVTGSNELGRFVDTVGTVATGGGTPASSTSGSGSGSTSSQPPPSRNPH